MTNERRLKAAWKLEEGDVFELAIDEQTRLGMLQTCKLTGYISLLREAWSKYWAVEEFLPRLSSGRQYLVVRKYKTREGDSEKYPRYQLVCVALNDGRFDLSSVRMNTNVADLDYFGQYAVHESDPMAVLVVRQMRESWS